MDDNFYYISLVITSESRTVTNQIIRVDKPADPQEAEEFDKEFREWVKTCPSIGKEPEFLIPLTEEAEADVIDETTVLAGKLDSIIERKDSFEFFKPPTQEDLDLAAPPVPKPFNWEEQP